MILLDAVAGHLFASAGGGGSGGGGGGGGGIIVLVGYLPMHFLGSRFRKRDKVKVGNYIVWPLAVIYSIFLVVAFHSLGFIIGIGALLGAGAGLNGWLDKLKRNKNAQKHLQQAAAMDSTWDPQALMTYSAQVMERYQYDCSNGDTEKMRTYLTPWYHYHVSLMMSALAAASRMNRMSDVKIIEQQIQNIYDSDDNTQDSFTMGFQVAAKDEIVDKRTDTTLFANTDPFTEFWTFVRNGNTWLLQGIMPGTADMSSENLIVKQFAEQNKFCYSLDWGWLLLPQRGQLFGKGRFGQSDINNHVIGMYNNLLIQIYTFAPIAAQAAKDQYLIAQAQLPKSYGEILVRRKKRFSLFSGHPKGLRKIETEWQDFNKKYDVYASTAEGPTTFELLHPAFMEVLEAQPFEVNLEVVDNVVYFYTKQTTLQAAHYPIFLDILQEAFKQMRL